MNEQNIRIKKRTNIETDESYFDPLKLNLAHKPNSIREQIRGLNLIQKNLEIMWKSTNIDGIHLKILGT